MTTQRDSCGQEPFSAPSTGAAIVTRFAPSPTGRLHLGHAYSALMARRLAGADGLMRLRIEDIDAGRSRPEFVAGIVEDLAWLGIDWDDDIWFQSARLDAYAEALERLKAQGLVYPCFCTRKAILEEIAASASAPHGPDGPLYPGTCRRMGDGERAARMAEPHAWRLDVAQAAALVPPLSIRTALGAIPADPARFGDVVLARKDAPASYHLAVTVDDAAQGISDVMRGEDLREATHVHRLLQALLGLPDPLYHFHGLICDSSGRRLAKRDGAVAIATLRDQGADPEILIAALAEGRVPAGYSLAKA